MAGRRLSDGAVGLRGLTTLQWRDSPIVQLAGTVVARSSDDLLELRRPVGGVPRLQLLSQGLDPDAAVSAPTRLYAWSRTPAQLTLTLAPVVGQPAGSTGRIAIAGAPGGRREVALAAGSAPQELTLPICGGRLALRLTPAAKVLVAGRGLAGTVSSARVARAPASTCRG